MFGAVLAPLVKLALIKLIGLEAGKWVFWALFVAVVVVLQLWTRREDLRQGLEGVVVTILPLSPFLLGGIGSVWCFIRHVCMAGHMHHPPYPEWHIWVDWSWVGLLVLAALLAVLFRSPSTFLITAFAAFLISFRFVFGSFGGIYWLPL